jgi:DNA-binding NarL/FixJ family response regulator
MRVVIAEDQALLRTGLTRLLRDAGFDVVAEAADAPDLVRKVAGHRPDLVVTDVRMPPGHTDDGLRAAREIRERFPGTAVVVLSQYVMERAAVDLIGKNAAGVGYLLKDRVADLDTFVDALNRVANGGSALDPDVVSRMIGRRDTDELDRLTPRERDVLRLMAEGRSNRGIAETLVVTEDAVEKHVNNLLRKLDITGAPTDHRRVMAVLAFLQRQHSEELQSRERDTST